MISYSHGSSEAMEMNCKERDESKAAVKLQKVYRSYRTRRRLADSAVVAKELWWQAIDYARLNHSTVSFFNFGKPETAASRWSRISLIASKVGKGLGQDAKAQKLAFQHWIEAIDPRHRYGHNLNLYYEEWCKRDAGQPFFYWLDVGDGKEMNLKECPRSKLQQECIKYLGPQERENYEYIIDNGTILHKVTENPLNTDREGSKWIFVMSTSGKFYASEKKKGFFHHSSFLAGGATSAAGRLRVENGKLKSVSAYSGHYRPTNENLDKFLAFLLNNGVDLDEVEVTNGYDLEEIPDLVFRDSYDNLEEAYEGIYVETERRNSFRRSLSTEGANMRKKNVMLQRIMTKNGGSSYQLGHQLSSKWSNGAGPRIGCVADYPVNLRVQAMEFVNLSLKAPTETLIDENSDIVNSVTTYCVVM